MAGMLGREPQRGVVSCFWAHGRAISTAFGLRCGRRVTAQRQAEATGIHTQNVCKWRPLRWRRDGGACGVVVVFSRAAVLFPMKLEIARSFRYALIVGFLGGVKTLALAASYRRLLALEGVKRCADTTLFDTGGWRS